MATVQEAITDAYTRIGVIAENETASAAQLAKGFSILNILTDQWGAERLTIPYIARSTPEDISPLQTSFTVGTGGYIDIVRPVYLTGVSYIQDSTATPTLEIPLRLLTDDEYRAIPFKGLESAYPTAAYYNPTYASGWGTLIPWPIPTASDLQWVLYYPVALPQFASTATTLLLPPGYHEFVVTALAAKLALIFGVVGEIRAEIQTDAAAAKLIIKAANFRISDLSMPAGTPQGGDSRYSSYPQFLAGLP